MKAGTILTEAAALGIVLYVEDGKLKYKAKKGEMPLALKKELIAHKEEIIKLMYTPLKEKGAVLPDIVPVERTERIPLSYAQLRLWFIDKLGEGSLEYNSSNVFSIDERVEREPFEKALRLFITRHESLRTHFQEIDGDPVQVIESSFELPLAVHDFTRLSADDAQLETQKLADLEAKTPFYLDRDLMIRVHLILQPNECSTVLYTLHHISSDGWSQSILQNELLDLYRACCANQPSPLAELPIQYADYTVWQREWLTGERLDLEMDYWRDQLAGIPATHNLPLDYQRPERQVFEGESFCQTLGAGLEAQLQKACKEAEVTLFIYLETLFALLLSRYTNESDIVIGSPISGRNHKSLEGLVGFFVNSLVLRTNVDSDDSIAVLLEKNKRTILEAYQHQNLPFEMLVEELRPERNLGYNSLFQISFVVETFSGRLSGSGGDHSAFDREGLSSAANRSIHFDLELYVYQSQEGLELRWIYNKKLFNSETIADMASNFRELVSAATESLLEKTQTPVNQLSLLSDSQSKRLLGFENNPASPTPVNKFVHTLFESQVKKSPHAVALKYRQEQLTYLELEKASNQLAHYLRDRGVSPDTPVGLCVPRSIDMIVGVLGILKSGGCYVPLDPGLPAERLGIMLDDSKAKLLITTQAVRKEKTFDQLEVMCIDNERSRSILKSYSTLAISPAELALSEHNLAYVLYTSGSTGNPKGVMVTHQNVVNYMSDTLLHLSDQLVGSVMSSALSFDATVGSLFSPLCLGKSIELLVEGDQLIERLNEYINHPSNAYLFKLAPAHMQSLINNGALVPSNTQHLFIIGGEKLPAPLVKKWRKVLPKVTIVNEYGPTETTVGCSTYTLGAEDAIKSNWQEIPIGKPIFNTQLYVLNKQLQRVPVGVTGELYIAGKGVSRGYHRNGMLTSEKFVANHFTSSPGERMYMTGDLVRWTSDGNLDFVGRIDDQIKLRGFRVELGEIENGLASNTSISEAVVIIDPRREKQEAGLIAYVCPTEGFLQHQALAYNQENVETWSTVFDGQYRDFTEDHSEESNFVGWNSSYTGEPIELGQMQEWLSGTMQQIDALKPSRVLEIGCGSGLLLYRYAEQCERVHAMDISTVALGEIQHALGKRDWQHVQLQQGDALTTAHLAGEGFDTVIVNSVAQYFPNQLYLEQCIEGILQCTQDGGKILFGDIRNLDLLTAFWAGVEQSQINKTTPVSAIKSRVQRRIRQEKELLISPSYFTELKTRFPQIDRVDIHLKEGQGDNEMLRYRYDVVLHKKSKVRTSTRQVNNWFGYTSLSQVKTLLENEQLDVFGVSSVPNWRISADVQLAEGLAYWQNSRNVFPIEQPGTLDKHATESIASLGALFDQAREAGWHYTMTWSQNQLDKIDLIFSKSTDVEIAARDSYEQSYRINYPQIEGVSSVLAEELEGHLKKFLPEYMIPNVFVALEKMPLTVRGKIDRSALPLPEEGDLQKDQYVAPESEMEKSLCQIWQGILKLKKIGVNDNFFSLGGHSLLATRLISDVRKEFNIELNLKTLFEHATVAALSEQITNIMLVQNTLEDENSGDGFEEVLD